MAVLAVCLLIAGCTQSEPIPAVTPTPTSAPTAGLPDLSPIPTDAVPTNHRILVSVSRGTLSFNPLLVVEFRGGQGMILLSSLEARVTRSDGTVETASMQEPRIGDTLKIVGSTYKDRIEVFSRMKDGSRYRIYDQVLEFRA
ncbi:MAG: hypothetical protein LUQ01_01240 [Methanolinea sp.]|nr:hypothetical protein [Methanolinea sp.]